MSSLSEIIEALEAMPQGGRVTYGFGTPESYRGYYDCIAFAPTENASIADMLGHARSALGKTFYGWKGGEYTMGPHTDCFIDSPGECHGDQIGPTLLAYWAMESGR